MSGSRNSNDFMKMMMASGGLGSLGAGFGSMFGNQQNPGDEASQYYNQIPGELQQAFGPYMQGGSQAFNQLPGIYQGMMDPNALIGKIGAGYQQSPGYQWQLNQGLNAIKNSQRANGMYGTPQHEQQSAQMAEGLANQDYYNYLNKALGLYGQGAQGMGNLANTGFNASRGYGEDLASALMSQGNLAYTNAINQNQQQGGEWGNLIGGAASLAPLFFM